MSDILDLRVIIEWLGVEGAREGLRKSEKLTVNELKKIADHYNIEYKNKIIRNDLISLLLLKFNRKIDKMFDELMGMRASELAEYLSHTNCSKEEIMELLKNNNIPFKVSQSRIVLIQYAADEISGLGMYKRIGENT